MYKVIMKNVSSQSSASGLFPVVDGSIGKPAPTVTGDCLPPSTPECLERMKINVKAFMVFDTYKNC